MSSNYPDGLSDWTPGCPWSEPEVPEEEFEVTCSQSLSRTATVWTDNYIPGASGVDYEPDGEGGYCASGWHDDPDTSDTNWAEEYESNGYKTPLQLIQMLREYLEKDLRDIQKDMLPNDRSYKATKARQLKGLIEECDCWTEDETEYIEES
jgi:hypothetical protein